STSRSLSWKPAWSAPTKIFSDKVPPYLRDRGDTLLCEPVRRAVARDSFLARDLEQAENGVVDLPRLGARALGRPAVQLRVHVDQAAPVDHVVRRVGDPALLEQVAVTILRQLIVRGAGHDLDRQAVHRVVVDHGPKGAGREDVGAHIVDIVRAHRSRPSLLHDPLHALRVDVGARDDRALGVEQVGEMIAHGAASLQSDALPAQAVRAVAVLGAPLDAAVDAVRSHGRGIARLADQAGDVVRLRLDILHVARARPDVFGGDVPPLERLDVATVGAEQRLAPRRAIVADDDALAAAQVEPRDRGLV